MPRGRGFALLAAWASLPACATVPPGPGPISDPAARVHAETLARGAYSITQLTGTCRPQPAEGRRARLIALADAMWVRFGRKERGAVTEAPNPDAGIDTDKAIAGFWSSVPADEDYTPGQWQRWRDAPARARREHWSAAFTSWLMCEAGLSLDQFARSYRHANYVTHAFDRLTSGMAAHRVVSIDDAPPEAGDLLCASKNPVVQGGTALEIPPQMHCSLVVQVSGGQVDMIGGNVDGAVVKIRTPLNGEGANARVARRAATPERPATHWHLLMKLRDPR